MKGKDIIPIAKQHIGERYILGARAVLSNPNHTGPWDCAEFTSWCSFQAYEIVFGTYGSDPDNADAYSGKWYEDANDKNVDISVDEALSTPGAFLIRKPNYRGIKVGHVAISDGRGNTLEARSRRHGVGLFGNARERLWTIGCILPGVEYNTESNIIASPDADILRLTQPYMAGPTVRKVQSRLSKFGFNPGDIDGVYGPLTEAAVLNFQAANGLAHDGEVGRETAEELGLEWPI